MYDKSYDNSYAVVKQPSVIIQTTIVKQPPVAKQPSVAMEQPSVAMDAEEEQNEDEADIDDDLEVKAADTTSGGQRTCLCCLSRNQIQPEAREG